MNRGPMPAHLAPISLRLASLRTWRDPQRFLAAYPDTQKSWRGYLRVQEVLLGPKPPREGIALRVTQYEDALTTISRCGFWCAWRRERSVNSPCSNSKRWESSGEPMGQQCEAG